MQNLNQDQLDRYNAFESMMDLMANDDTVAYTKAEIAATIDQLVEMAKEDREAELATEASPVELYTDRYTVATNAMNTQALLAEATRIEAMDSPDEIDSLRHNFVRRELKSRNVI